MRARGSSARRDGARGARARADRARSIATLRTFDDRAVAQRIGKLRGEGSARSHRRPRLCAEEAMTVDVIARSGKCLAGGVDRLGALS